MNMMTTVKISKNLSSLVQSEIRNMSIECDKVNGINLSQGICDLPLLPFLEQGVLEAMQRGCNHYTPYNGIFELRNEIAKKEWEYNHIKCSADNVIVSAGATGALYCTCFALFEKGDEILLFEPYYGYHEYTLTSLDLKPIYAKLTPPEWSFNVHELQKLVTEKTKAILICTPSNPCGKVFNEEELNAIADFAIKNNLYVITDEIYEYIVYNGHRHVSPGSLEKIKDRTITISGYSKTFSITGWRIGYTVANEEITHLIGMANDLLYVCAPAPLQYGVANAIHSVDKGYYQKIQNDFFEKRELLCETLEKVKMTPYIPQGAYYILANVENLPGRTAKERAMWLLKETGIGTVPGSAFFKGENGESFVRFCFAKDLSIIKNVCKKLEITLM